MMQKQLEDLFTSVQNGTLDIDDAMKQIEQLKSQNRLDNQQISSESDQEQDHQLPDPILHKEDIAQQNSVQTLQAQSTLPVKIQSYLLSKLQTQGRDPLQLSDMEKNLMDLGLDSIQLTELTLEIEAEAAISLPATLFFEYPNIKELTEHFAQEHADAFNRILNITPAPVTPTSLLEENATAMDGFPAFDEQPVETSVDMPLQSQTTSMSEQAKTLTQLATIRPPSREIGSALPNSDIAIIGMNGLFAESPNLDRFWQNIIEQKNLICEIPPNRFDLQQWYKSDPQAEDSIYCKWGSFIEDVDAFDAGFFGISPNEADWMDPQLRLMLQSIYATSEDAGYAAKMRGSNTGIFVGICYQDYKDRIIEAGWPMDPYMGTGNSYAVLANRASFLFDFTGPSLPIDTACSSSLFALHAARTALLNQECDMAFVAGVNLILSPFRYRYFCNLGALSHTGRCYTFDAAADGYVPGEAIASVLLKPLWKAEEDGDCIHAIIKGSAALHGGYTPSLTAPSVQGETNVILKAWENAQVDPTTLSYIEAHGTGTPLGDPIEINALKKAFASYTDADRYRTGSEHLCAIGSAKAHLGHTEGAAGLTGLIKVVLQMKHQQIPGMPTFNEQNPHIDLSNSPLYINRDTVPWATNGSPRRGGISSFGFSGSYAHVVVEEYQPQLESARSENLEPVIVPLSAKSADGLRRVADNLRGYLTDEANQTTHSLQNIAYTLQDGRASMEFRAAFVVHTMEELKEQLTNVDAVSRRVRKENLFIFEADEDLQALLNSWIAKGKMSKIAELWSRGWEVDWQMLYPEQRPRLVSLPTYPFAKERYWFTTTPSKETPVVNHQQHPQVMRQKIVGPSETTFTDSVPEPISAQQIVNYLTEHLEAATGIPQAQLDIHEEVQNYGFDSIVITKLAGELETLIGKKDTSIFFSANTIATIAENIHRKYQASFPSQASSQFHRQATIPTDQPAPSTGENEPVDGKANDIAIIGIAGKYPQADCLYDYFENLKSGKDCIEEIPPERWDYDQYLGKEYENGKIRAKWGGFIAHVNEFDYESFHMSFREALITHPEERLLLEQAWHCFESAGYNPLTWINGSGSQTGVYIGVSFHEYPHLIAESNQLGGEYVPYSTQTFSYANRLSYFYNLIGPSVTLDTACSSSLFAIYEACKAIRSGTCQTAIAGGVNLNLHPSKFILLSDLNFLSVDGRCHSFVDGGDGYVPGEGIGLVLLKRLEQAEEENDNILAVIKGISAGNDGRTTGFTVPNPEAQSAIIHQAIQNAAVNPETITYIECHGTGTALGDPIEIAALTNTFSSYTSKSQFCAVSSVKSNIGHLEAAAGIAQLTKVILQFKRKLLFPTVMHGPQLNQNIQFADTPFYVQRDLAAWDNDNDTIPRKAGISSFGAGGTNVHLILEEYQARYPQSDAPPEGSYHIVPFSADSKEQLFQTIQDTNDYLSDAGLNLFDCAFTVNNIAGTLQHGRAMKKVRLAIICDNHLHTLLDKFKEVLRLIAAQEEVANNQDIFYDVVENHPSLNAESNLLYQIDSEIELIEIARQWVAGAAVDWVKVSRTYDRVILPGYRFKRSQVDLSQYHAAQAILADGGAMRNGPTRYGTTSIVGDNPMTTIKEHIMRALRKGVGVLADEFDDDSDFANYGIDSITSTRVLAELSTHYGKLNSFVLLEHNTVEKLANHLLVRRAAQVDKIHNEPVTSSANTIGNTLIGETEEIKDNEGIGEIQNVQFGDGKDDLIPFGAFITAYKEQGGKHNIEQLSVPIRENKSIEVIACGQGETIVLLPPFNSSAIIWIQQLLTLSKHYRVLVLHYPGLGESHWLDELNSFENLATVVLDALNAMEAEHLAKGKTATFIGWSFGGFLAQAIAAAYPDRVKKLILVNTTAISWSSDEYQISSEEFSRKSAQEFRENYRRLPLFVRKMPIIQRWHKENQVEKFVLGTQEKVVINRYFLMIARFQHLDIAQQISSKTFLISGADDALMPAQFARRLHENIADSEYFEVEGGRHFLSLFKKDVVNRKLEEWLMR